MAELKREYVVPLRRKVRTAPKWRRSKKAVSVLKEFICKHMKTENVVLCEELNEHIWANGAKNPPGKVSVIAVKTKDEKAIVNLANIGVDEQMKHYTAPATAKTEEKPVEEVKEAEVKEVEKKEEKTTEEKAEEKKPAKKEAKKE